MSLIPFAATATTCEVASGSEHSDEAGRLRIDGRIFTDVVESNDPRIAGTNTPVLDIVVDPASGSGELQGTFVLRPAAIEGAWEGRLIGQIREGLVWSQGIARGTGALAGYALRVDFQQVREGQGEPPCAEPKAFFEMQGLILEGE